MRVWQDCAIQLDAAFGPPWLTYRLINHKVNYWVGIRQVENRMKSSRQERIEQLLRAAFPAALFELFDDSHEHAGHAHGQSGETHYRLRIKDESFRGESRLKSQRRILSALKPEFDSGLHSLVIEEVAPP
jgi:BolA protein